MNMQHLEMIANQFQFKLTTKSAQQIPAGPGGGHLCWKVNAENEIFLIKQLDPMLNVNNEKIINRYELCESVAFRFAQLGIPAIFAITNGNKAVTVIENTAYLVFPWIEGHTLGRNEVAPQHAIKIVETVAKIHIINLNVPEIEPKLDIHTNKNSHQFGKSYFM